MADELLERIEQLVADLRARRARLSGNVERLREQEGHLSQAAALYTQAMAEVQAAGVLETDAEPLEIDVPVVRKPDVPLAQPKRGRPPKHRPLDRADIIARSMRGEGVREIARATGHHHSTITQILQARIISGVADDGKAPGLGPDNAGSIPAPGNSDDEVESSTSLDMPAPIPPARLNVPRQAAASKFKDESDKFVPPIPDGIDWRFELRCDSVVARLCRRLARNGPRSPADLALELRCAAAAIDAAIARLGSYLQRLPNGNLALVQRVPGINDPQAMAAAN